MVSSDYKAPPLEVSRCLDRCRQLSPRNFRHRLVTHEWRYMLLYELDRPIIRGEIQQLVGKSLGAGVYEVTLKENKDGT